MHEMIAQKMTVLRETFNRGQTRPIAWRMGQLRALLKLIEENKERLCETLKADLGKPRNEAYAAEIIVTQKEVKDTMDNLASWMKPETVKTPLVMLPGKSKRYRDPLGVVLIIGAWNYPVNLVISPLIGALAAGNAVVVKPSEVSEHTSALIAKLIPDYLDNDAVQVIEGGVDETTVLLEHKFDHILYTGNGRVGRIIMAAAAKNLTPVTLELGGKSPVYIDETADLPLAIKRIIWGKFNNAGQTCIAPDYVLVDAKRHDDFVRGAIDMIKQFYGDEPQKSADYGRIVNARHHQRLMELMPGGTPAIGGGGDADDLFIEPTILTDVDLDSRVMADEIFGPILPVVPVHHLDEAITFINARPKPLALYMFSQNDRAIETMLTRTSSGGVTINHVMVHFGVATLPFGGVGESGMGAYHGRETFEVFSHKKSVLSNPLAMDLPLLYPPYNEAKLKWLNRLL